MRPDPVGAIHAAGVPSLGDRVARRIARVAPHAPALASAMAILGDGGALATAGALTGISGPEAGRIAYQLRRIEVLSAEDPGSRMNRLGRQQITTGEILSIDELIDRYDRIEMEDIRRVAARVLGGGKFGVTVLGPFDEGAFDRYAA